VLDLDREYEQYRTSCADWADTLSVDSSEDSTEAQSIRLRGLDRAI
jgi:hypothetical protein